MGKFDGILICSDWDGTLFTGECVPEDSVRAIKYFQDNGDRFTLCSGRPPFYIKDMLGSVHPNTYTLALNGTVICDMDTGEIVRESFIDEDAYRIADELLNSGIKMVDVVACMKEMNDYYRKPPAQFLADREMLMSRSVYKLAVTCADPNDGDRLMEFAKTLSTGKYSIQRSGKGYAEIILTKHSKGYAARALKEMIGARLLVCMGDYENDVPMFRLADVSYAVGNAIPRLKAIATHVIDATVNECAVVKIIEDIERRYL